MILLPGLDKQLKFIKSKVDLKGLKILIIGNNTEEIAKELSKDNNVEIVVEDYESLLNTKLLISDKTINVKMMDYERTDYGKEELDIIYLQGTISDIRRNSMLKEIKRIMKPDGYLCIGEIVYLNKNIPQFISDIFDASNLDPLYIEEINSHYETRGFKILDSQDISSTLKEYYSMNLSLLEKNRSKLTESEKSYYKKVLSKISHESKAYLNLGGEKYFGFKVYLLKKN